MKRVSWHTLPILFLAFFCFLAVSTAQDDHHHAVDQQPLQDDIAAGSEQQWGYYEEQGQGKEEGEGKADHAQDALKILRKIKPPTVSKLARYTRKPKGFLGSTAYYAKQAFMLLFMNSPKQTDLLASSNSYETHKLSAPLAKAVNLLHQGAMHNEPDSIFLLAEMFFYGNYTHPVNYLQAFYRYKQLADLDGNSTAQYMLGFMYGVGIHPDIPVDQPKSLLYHTFAAEQGNTRSEMTLGYRYHSGISTSKNCDEAVHWYKRVADKAVRYYLSGPPGGHVLIRDAYRLADEDGGVYGEGASASSSGVYAKRGGPTSDENANLEDVLEYLYMESNKGDLRATFGLARLYLDGERGLKRDFKIAKKYFLSIARLYWTESGNIRPDASPLAEKLATRAAGHLGRMFLRGDGVEVKYNIAQVWFKRAIANGDALSQYSLGLMYLDGLGVQQDVAKAVDLLTAAADQDLPVAQTELGILFLDRGDTQTASQYFELAIRNGHIEAFYYLAEMSNFAIGRERSCGIAANFYKITVEKAEAVWASLPEANEAFEEGDHQKALIGYLMAAEQGSENSQANVAFLLDQTKPRWSPLVWLGSVTHRTKAAVSDAAVLALTYWTRSAKQQNWDSLVKMGDYYLSGTGTAAGVVSAEKAAQCYQSAAENLGSAQAMWNLGWMHENGIGIEQDFHLAKRYYDQAYETNVEAYLPVQLSLWKLRWRSWWNRVTRGDVHGIEDEDENAGGKSSRPRSFAEWVQDFLEADARQYYQDNYEADDWESDAHSDAAKNMPGGDDYWDEDLEGEIWDLLLIGGLIAALGGLIWYRQQQQRAAEQRRQEGQGGNANANGQQAQQPGQQPDGGFFPDQRGPEWNDWVAGGVGH